MDRAAYQPWTDHPIHRESTYALVMRGEGNGTPPRPCTDEEIAIINSYANGEISFEENERRLSMLPDAFGFRWFK